MNGKCARRQFMWEFNCDFLVMIIANLISFSFFRFIIPKIIVYDYIEWIEYAITLVIAFSVLFITFHKSIDIHNRNRIKEGISVIKNTVITYLAVIAILALLKNDILESRYFIISGFFSTVVLTTIERYMLKRWLTGHFTKSKITSLVGVITTEDLAQSFVTELQNDWTIKLSGIALLNRSEAAIGGTAVKQKLVTEICDVPVVADDESFLDWIRSSPLDEVYINIPYKTSSEVQEMVEELEDMGITVHINIPVLDKMLDESKFNNINCRMQAGYPMATFSASVADERMLAIKRIMDIILGALGCIVSIPIIAIVAVPLLIESPGPLFFKQDRVGRNGRIFKCYKLRSMYKDAEKRKAELMNENQMNGFMFKMDNDPRITRVGKFIRKYSIDELPQFFNVVKGDMSLVGTRPPTVDEFNQYESRHKRRLSMRPGITGMWQVSGRSNITDFEEVVKLDCQYIDEWSLLLDIKILFKTVIVVLTHKGAE